jgi:hypothetical protein
LEKDIGGSLKTSLPKRGGTYICLKLSGFLGFSTFSDVSSKAAAKVKIKFSFAIHISKIISCTWMPTLKKQLIA